MVGNDCAVFKAFQELLSRGDLSYSLERCWNVSSRGERVEAIWQVSSRGELNGEEFEETAQGFMVSL